MLQTDAQEAGRGAVGAWIFRGLLVAGAAFMVYSWFSPWWAADVAIFEGENDLVLHPWGIETVAEVRAGGDASLYAMPWFFAPFMWAYLTLCMLALAASLFLKRAIPIGRFKLPVATALILFVGLSYLVAVGLAYGIGEIRAAAVGTNFIGKSTFLEVESGAEIKMVSVLKNGYWLALYAGAALSVLGLLRRLIVGKQQE